MRVAPEAGPNQIGAIVARMCLVTFILAQTGNGRKSGEEGYQSFMKRCGGA